RYILCSKIYSTEIREAVMLTTFFVTIATIIKMSASQPSPISLTSVLGSELSGLNSPVVNAIPIVAVTPTKTNQTKDEVAPISGATVADFGVPVYLVNSAIPSTQARLNAAIVSTAVPIGIAS